MSFNAVAVKEQEQKKPRKVKRQINALTEVYPVSGITSEGYIKLRTQSDVIYMAMFESKKYDLDFLDDQEFNSVTDAYWNLQKSYLGSYKEIFMTFPEENKVQQDYFLYKIEHTTNPKHLEKLQLELDKLKHIEEHYEKLSTYPCIFGETREELAQNIKKITRLVGGFLDFTLITRQKSQKILTLLNNTTTGVVTYQPSSDKEDQDLSYIKATQPKGGISVKNEFYNRFGDSYSACIHVVEKPTLFREYWIYELSKMKNTTLIMDYGYEKDENYQEIVSDSMEELIAQKGSATTQAQIDLINEELDIMRHLNVDLSSTGEVIKKAHIRIFIYESTQEKLEERAAEILIELKGKGFTGTVGLNEQKEEYQSMFLPYDEQVKLKNKREGIEFPAEVLGLGFGLNQTSLADPSGRYYGYTRTGGTVYWDLFIKSPQRLSYNVFIGGSMGSGKSTLLKTILQDCVSKGYFIRGFDKSGEFTKLVKNNNGIIIKLDGSDGCINMLQVFGSVTKQGEDNLEVDVNASFLNHISVLGKKMKLYKTDATTELIDLYESAAREFYEEIGLWNNPDVVITELENHEYPILEDLLTFINKREEAETKVYRQDLYGKIALSLDSMVNSYGDLFNGHTSIVDMANTQVVMFDIGALSALKEEVFDVQFTSAMTLIQDDLMALGRREKEAFDSKEKHWWQIIRSIIVNDECHNTLNTDKPDAVSIFVTLMSEARKFFISILNATQTIERMFPKMDNVSEGRMAKAADKLKEIVKLSQYKVILKQDSTSIPMLRHIFETMFTESEYQQMSGLETSPERGSMGILCGAGPSNLHMTFQVTAEELALYSGGA